MTEKEPISDEFIRIIKDFINDVRITFPEYEPFIGKLFNKDELKLKYLFEFCQTKFPPRFVDILYQNEDMFKQESTIDTEFLPNIHFKNLWQCDISQQTKDSIWKYLQLIMFSIIGTIDNKNAFGDTAKIFEDINEEDFKTKINEILSKVFEQNNNDTNDINPDVTDPSNSPSPSLNADEIHQHITGMMTGKLGQLARDIAEETAANIDIDFNDSTNMQDIFQKLMTNPSKLMGLVKTVGDKLDSKLKSGDIKESELMTEATEMMNNMKNMPGMENIQDMLSKLGLQKGKVNMAATEAHMEQKLKLAKTKERILAKSQSKAREKAMKQAIDIQESSTTIIKKHTDEELIKLFGPEKPPRTNKKGKK